MALKFYFGGSGAGKSTKVYQDVIDWSLREPDRRFFIIVPDQFTMQTQKDLVCMHPDRGIMNIDVLSFGRLTHRILEEVGGEDIPVLDDTGKNLVLRKVAAEKRDSLPVIGAHLNRTGYIHEVKSVISEFMQYGISPEQVGEMAKQSAKRGMLAGKLRDLQILYEAFLNYIREKFITSEESLELLCRSLSSSKLIRDSVVVFDGFTGFTPVQNRVVQELMVLCKQVCVTIIIDPTEEPYETDEEQKLFHLSKKTVQSLCKLQEQAGVGREPDVFLPSSPVYRYRDNPCLNYLEQNLFRYGKKPYAKAPEAISLYKLENPEKEVRFVCREIRRLVRSEGLQYRDIAVVTGDLACYADLLQDEFSQYNIPCFIDRTTGILLNPFVEFIRSALQVILKQYSYESVFHYLRSGMAELKFSEGIFTMEDIDEFENYVRAAGIRGRRQYENLFTRHTERTGGDGEMMERLNQIREAFVAPFEILHRPAVTMAERVDALYDFIVQAGIQEKLLQYEKQFEEAGNPAKAKEYGQIYRLVMQLLEQMTGLLGTEEVSWTEFYEILDAGLSEIQVGAIPQNVDRVVLGDIERTRLTEIKVLFFIGLNDGIIPKSGGAGGMISDLDREFLHEANWELSPTPRQKMYTQRLYLYMNLTKPVSALYLTYAGVGSDGKSRRPAYLVQTLKKMYPALVTKLPRQAEEAESIQSRLDAFRMVTPMLRDYAAGYYDKDETMRARLKGLLHLLKEEPSDAARLDVLMESAFYSYRNTPLTRAAAQALYGVILANSVSRLERFAECEYRHFLEYGLKLKEREEFELTSRDMGTLYHEILSRFSDQLSARGLTWFTFTKEQGEELLEEVIHAYTAEFEKSILYSSARSEYAIHTLKRLMARSIDTLQYQLKKGMFEPRGFEISFQTLEDLASVNFTLPGEQRVRLSGRIDRLDVCEDEDHIYVKVIDYKSGKKDFDLVSVYHGLTLQLVLYLNVAMEREKKAHPDKEIVPAGLFYYRMDNPLVETDGSMAEEEIEQAVRKELKMAGAASDDPAVIRLLDQTLESGGRSDTVPVQMKADGSVSALSRVYSKENLRVVSDYVNHKIQSLSTGILSGGIEKNPYEYKEQKACDYCQYKEVCTFDEGMEGYHFRQIEKEDEAQLLKKMEEDTGGSNR